MQIICFALRLRFCVWKKYIFEPFKLLYPSRDETHLNRLTRDKRYNTPSLSALWLDLAPGSEGAGCPNLYSSLWFSHSVHIHSTHPVISPLPNSFTLHFTRSSKNVYLFSAIILKKSKLDPILLTTYMQVFKKCIINATESISSHWFDGVRATAFYTDAGLYSTKTRIVSNKAGDDKHI